MFFAGQNYLIIATKNPPVICNLNSYFFYKKYVHIPNTP